MERLLLAASLAGATNEVNYFEAVGVFDAASAAAAGDVFHIGRRGDWIGGRRGLWRGNRGLLDRGRGRRGFIHAFETFFETLQPFAQSLAQLRQLTAAKNQKSNCENQ